MTIDIDGLVAAGRSLAEQTMKSEGTITRPAVGSTLDLGTGDSTPSPATTVHAGQCRVRMPSLMELETLSGDEQVTRLRLVVSFPATIPDVLIGDVVVLTKCADPRLLTRSFRVTSVTGRSVLMYRQLAVEVVE